MNISFDSRDAVRGVLKLEIGKADYTEKLEKSLRSFRTNVNLPGFRKGMAPMGVLKKLYGKHLLIEEINKIANEMLTQYIDNNQELNILGHPILSRSIGLDEEFDLITAVELLFDVAFVPQVNIELSKEDVLPYYNILVDDTLVEEQIEMYRTSHGAYEDSLEKVTDNDIIKGVMTELNEDGHPKENGIVVEEAMLLTQYVKNPAELSKFIGAQKGDTIIFNPRNAYDGATSVDSEIASLLTKAKQEVAELKSDFSFEIKTISQHRKAELDQSLFDKVLGEGVATNEVEFRQKVKENLAKRFIPQSNMQFYKDLRPYLFQKVGDMPIADEIVKQLLQLKGASKEATEEDLAAGYALWAEEVRYDAIASYILEKNGLQVNDKDLSNIAYREVQFLFANYGIAIDKPELISHYVNEMLKNKDKVDQLYNAARDEKLATFAKEAITLEVKDVTIDEFADLSSSSKKVE
ncbi:MAG: trigger factor [Tannerellaceae bacterium]|jgi:trigger factor|nr:trigger factor [Tannerellaceae bacterium]